MLLLLKQIFESHYLCLAANNGEQGLTIAKEQIPDLIICDVMMPKIDGFEVLQQLKTDPITDHIPVVLLTAKGDKQSRMQGWAYKADDYISKPFDADELILRIDSLLCIRQLLNRRLKNEFALNPTEQQAVFTEPDSPEDINMVAQKFIDNLNQVLEQHYHQDDFDVAALADKLYMSRRQITRKVKGVLDLTPVESIRAFRLKKAAELLLQGIAPGDVAYSVGFSSHSYFAQCFKAQYKCKPSEYVSDYVA